MQRGLFIVFEGCDGAGKSTQVQRLADSGLFPSCEKMIFPDRTTPIGVMIDQYLRNSKDFNDRAIHLLFSANRWELSGRIETLLAQGTSIICDRYWFSGTAYSAAKGIDIDWCRAPEAGLPTPDLVIWLDMDVEALASRRGFGTERYEKLEMQTRVRNAYRELQGENWVVVDAAKTMDDVTAEIQSAVKKLLTKE